MCFKKKRILATEINFINMKKFTFIVILMSLYVQNVWGQCLPCTPPNPMDYQLPGGKFDNGFYPESDTAYVGTAYDQEVKVVFPKDTVAGIITARFTEFRIVSITNVPAGIQLVLDDPDSVYVPANSNVPAVACVHACGTPTTANNTTDSVVIDLYAKTDLNINENATAKYHLRVLGNVGKAKAWEMGLKYEVYPNPATNFATLHYAVDYNTDVYIEILDVTGKKWNSFYRPAQNPGDYYLPLMEEPLPNGIYLIKIATSKGETTHKLVVNQ